MTDFKSKVQIQWSFFFPTVRNETCIVAESIFTTVTVQQSKISKKKKTKIIFKSTLFFFKPNKTNIYFNSCSNYIFIYVEANFSQVVRYVVLLYSILFFPIQSPKGTVRYAPLNKWPKYWQGEKSSRFKYVQKLKHLHEHTHTHSRVTDRPSPRWSLSLTRAMSLQRGLLVPDRLKDKFLLKIQNRNENSTMWCAVFSRVALRSQKSV